MRCGPAPPARIFRETGVARSEPRKKPGSAWRRFVYPAPNDCWQLDATEYVPTGGRTCVIFQLIDDHCRCATVQDAMAVFDTAVAAHGAPGRVLTDNGPALNPSRRGLVGRRVAHVAALGTEAITATTVPPRLQPDRPVCRPPWRPARPRQQAYPPAPSAPTR